MSDALPVRRLILVPALITLAVTLLRLTGELLGWSPSLFNRDPGGGGALIGIVWLVPIFGAWFGWRLVRAGSPPARLGPVFGYSALALLIVMVVMAVSGRVGIGWVGRILIMGAAALLAVPVAMRGWPALGRVLVVYGLAARVPVVLIMLAAILGNWGTHYEGPPPGFPEGMNPVAKWFLIGVVPQLTMWIAFTVVIGMLFGGLAAALARRGAVATVGTPARAS